MNDPLTSLLANAKQLAIEYSRLTGRPLGITGEVAEYEAARLLGLELAGARSPGYDAIERTADREKRIQIKGRRRNGPVVKTQRMGAIDLTKEFDTVMLVILDEAYETVEILEAPREAVQAHLLRPGSRARNERRQMATNAFRALAVRRWPLPDTSGV